jgi:membrane fusion protein (multidrug efflux system)
MGERSVMSLGKQIVVAVLAFLVLGGGGYWYVENARSAGDAAGGGRRGDGAAKVETRTVGAATLSRRIEAVGTTKARQAVDIVAMASGRVVGVEFRPGSLVEAGDVLLRLDEVSEQAAVDEAAAELSQTDLALERAKKLLSNNTVAQATIDQLDATHRAAQARLDAARKQLAEREVKAPFAGKVGLQAVDVGARVDDDTTLTTLDDLGEVEIDFSVPELFYGAVEKGQTVRATAAAFEDRVFEGEIRTIDSRVDPVSRAFQARAAVANPDLALPAGMFMHVELILERREALVVPEEALLAAGDRVQLFVVEDGKAARRDVTIGQREYGMVEITEGLAAGEQVVVSGLQRLRPDAAVEVLNQAPAEERPASGAPSA